MTFQGVRHSLRGLLLVGALVAAGGCGDGSSASPDPTETTVVTAPPTSDPEPTPEPVPTDRAGEPLVPPERPAAMDNDDEAGARAAAEYFVELFAYAVRTQDSGELEAFCESESNFCSGIVDEISADLVEGNITVGGAATFSIDRLDIPAELPFYVAWGDVERSPFVVYDKAGDAFFEDPGSAGPFMVAVQFSGHGWVVKGAEAGVVPAS